MMLSKIKVLLRVLFCLLFIGFSYSGFATHLRAGQITVERVNCASHTYRITIRVYLDTESGILFGGQGEILNFGDGQFMEVPQQPNVTPLPEFGPNFGTVAFSVIHTYPGPGTYTVSYVEPNRNFFILNMDNSGLTTFYLETRFVIDPFFGCNNTPVLEIAPLDQACTGVAFSHNPGAFDPDGDSLSYEFVVPFRDREQEVINYRDPNLPEFYQGLNYNQANENGDGPPTFTIDPVEGTIVFDAPGAEGEYNIAFIVKEWRRIQGQWYPIGFVRRDMQIIVQECTNNRPDLIVPEDICVEAGTLINETILGIDPDNNNVKIEAFSEIFNFAPSLSPATVTPDPAVFQPTNPEAELEFSWQTLCAHVKDQPYQIVFKITDNGSPRLVTFKTWRITVVGPAPQWVSADLVPATRSAELEWEDYSCTNASSIQVWRKVDGSDYMPEECVTGIPESLGYTMIAQLPLKDAFGSLISTYTDTNNGLGLAAGARYCYRLVAVFPQPNGGESYVSEDICVGPLIVDAPVITNVSVEKTDPSDGEILIRWVEPFEADPGQFPPPYVYEVYRGVGFNGTPGASPVHSGTLNQLSFTDSGINTRDNIFNYRIVCYDNNGAIVGTSAAASSVRLDLKSQIGKIQLSWKAEVPWTNELTDFPDHNHLIFRGPEDATEAEMVLIDSVNVLINGFAYLDEGQFNGEPLDDNTEYCYRIETRGGYGNPAIEEPLKNFSQIICALPSDSDPPCKPTLEAFIVDCDTYINQDNCNPSSFINEVKWRRPECADDIRSYNVYAAGNKGGQYILIAENVIDTFFVDGSLSSLARCYRISAVDQSGNESELSDPVCNDNCPYYELPNVFTPNGDGCNDLFRAFDGYTPPTGEESGPDGCSEIAEDNFRCARFVESVRFVVYNRWGKEVYEYEGRSTSENNIYINWDGRDKNGGELSSAVYYYMAEVTFTVVDPSEKVKIIKGWVHLVR